MAERGSRQSPCRRRLAVSRTTGECFGPVIFVVSVLAINNGHKVCSFISKELTSALVVRGLCRAAPKTFPYADAPPGRPLNAASEVSSHTEPSNDDDDGQHRVSGGLSGGAQNQNKGRP